MSTLKMPYRWLQLGLKPNLLLTVIIQHYRRIITHYKYVLILRIGTIVTSQNVTFKTSVEHLKYNFTVHKLSNSI